MARKRVLEFKPKEEYSLERCYKELGVVLAKARIKKGLTQREVSIKLGYNTAQYISNFERGISPPPLWRLKLMIKIYEIDPQKVIDLMLSGTREFFTARLVS